jgi:hypothetical protein
MKPHETPRSFAASFHSKIDRPEVRDPLSSPKQGTHLKQPCKEDMRRENIWGPGSGARSLESMPPYFRIKMDPSLCRGDLFHSEIGKRSMGCNLKMKLGKTLGHLLGIQNGSESL